MYEWTSNDSRNIHEKTYIVRHSTNDSVENARLQATLASPPTLTPAPTQTCVYDALVLERRLQGAGILR